MSSPFRFILKIIFVVAAGAIAAAFFIIPALRSLDPQSHQAVLRFYFFPMLFLLMFAPIYWVASGPVLRWARRMFRPR
ncbi:MAG: hypothetical protein ACLFPX_08370 [Candidatus Omnitrophota bacterium]